MKTLILGGSGDLGSHLRNFFPEADCPTSKELDVSMPFPNDLPDYKLVINAAALVNKKCDSRGKYVNGSPCPAEFCVRRCCKYLYVSTEYVFGGDRGCYEPDEEPLPGSIYGWTKRVGELAAMWVANHLIVRASFMPDPFPYPTAYTNQISAKIPTVEAARRIAEIAKSQNGIVHIAGPIRSIYDYACSRGANVQPAEMPKGENNRPMNSSLVDSLQCAYHLYTVPRNLGLTKSIRSQPLYVENS